MLDGKAFGAEMTEIVKGYVDRATQPLLKRIEVLEARPAPKQGEPGKPGESIKGDSGVGVAGALIDRSGVLVLTLSDGTTRDLGLVVGKDAEPVDVAALERRIDEQVAALPKPKDGENGFSLDDFDVNVADDGRTIVMSFDQGEKRFEAEMKFPVVLYRGVFKEGEEYSAGDSATWGGSLWIAGRDTKAKPDSPDSGWRLAVKKGRDGKDAK